MLQVSKKAATEAEAEAILDASFQVQKPFSVPVLLIDAADYVPKKILGLSFFGLSFKKQIREKLEAVIQQCPEPTAADHALVHERGFFSNSVAQIQDSIIRTIKDHWRYGDDYLALAMPNAAPRLSVALQLRAKDVVRTEMSYALRFEPDKSITYPGFDAQHNFLSLWHEITHSVAGDNEAGADYVSALACRYAFEDCTFLKVQSDMRAINAVMEYQTPAIIETYGWPCVDALEAAIAQKEPPTWDEVRKAGESAHLVPRRLRLESVVQVGQTLREKATKAFNTRNFGALAEATENLLHGRAFKNDEQTMIAERFALAARRLSIGTPAYQEPAPKI